MSSILLDVFTYLGSAIGGAFAFGISHCLITPLEILKSRQQVDPNFKPNIFEGIYNLIKSKQATLGLKLGLFGYTMKGFVKITLYDAFKKVSQKNIPQINYHKYKLYIWISAFISAEIGAGLILCPYEGLKIQFQTKTTSIKSQMIQLRDFIKRRMNYKGIIPLWIRQITSTVIFRFYLIQKVYQYLYEQIFIKPRQYYSKYTKVGIHLTSCFIAAGITSIISHPADTILTRIYSQNPIENSALDIYKKVWQGLRTRTYMLGILSCFQWSIYTLFSINKQDNL